MVASGFSTASSVVAQPQRRIPRATCAFAHSRSLRVATTSSRVSTSRVNLTFGLTAAAQPQRSRCPSRSTIVAEATPGKTEELNKTEVEDEEESVEEASAEAVSNGASEAAAAEEEAAPAMPPTATQTFLQSFREAVASNDEAGMADAEAWLERVVSERDSLEQKVAALTSEVSTGKDRFLRLNADFDNYRKRSERDRQSTAGNVRGDVIKSLLPMVDNFERAKTSIKTETEGEQKIDNSYQGIYKQFVEIMKSLGVVAVDTVGKEFDPNLHEAIMREDSEEYAEGIVTLEFQRGFAIGDKLLRPAMVKVSSGPGPAAAAPTDLPVEESLSSE